MLRRQFAAGEWRGPLKMSASKPSSVAACALSAPRRGGRPAPRAPSRGRRSAENMKAHITFLASDLLEGREAGLARLRHRRRLRGLAVRAAGPDAGRRQRDLLPARAAGGQPSGRARAASWCARAPGATSRWCSARTYFPGRTPVAGERQVSAPLVFVGYGVVAPEHGRDDYKGLDVKGKIVVVLAGAPAGFQTEERAYYANGRTKRRAGRHARRGRLDLRCTCPPTRSAARSRKGMRTWQTWAHDLARPGRRALRRRRRARRSLGRAQRQGRRQAVRRRAEDLRAR